MTRPRPQTISYRFVGARARAFQPLVAGVDRLGYALINRNRALEDGAPVRSLAVIQPSGLGDILMTLPVLRRLKAEWGGRIILGVSPAAADWVRRAPFVDQVLPVDIGPLVGRAARPGVALAALVSQLRAVHADAVYEVRGDIRLTGLIRLAAPRARIGGFTCGGGGFILDRALGYRLNDHIASMYAALLGEFGLAGDPLQGWDPALIPVEPIDVTIPEEAVAVHVGTGFSSKQWPMDRFVQLIAALAADGPVAVLGGPGDLEPAQRAALSAMPGAIDLVGRLSFGQTLAAIARCRLYVGQDTGATHGAALLGKPFVALYSGVDDQRFMPMMLRRGQGLVLQNRPPCSEEHGCARRVCADNICMSSIGLPEVLTAIRTLAARPDSPDPPEHRYARPIARPCDLNVETPD